LCKGQRYEAVVQVRKEGVKAFLVGFAITTLTTDYTNLSLLAGWALPDRSVLGLGCFESHMAFQRVEVMKVTDRGTYTGPDDPAAKKAAAQQTAQPAR
jgi:hypothetical protein